MPVIQDFQPQRAKGETRHPQPSEIPAIPSSRCYRLSVKTSMLDCTVLLDANLDSARPPCGKVTDMVSA